jgi:hypothetical protein
MDIVELFALHEAMGYLEDCETDEANKMRTK